MADDREGGIATRDGGETKRVVFDIDIVQPCARGFIFDDPIRGIGDIVGIIPLAADHGVVTIESDQVVIAAQTEEAVIASVAE